MVLVVAFVGAQAVERLLDGESWRSLEVKVDGARWTEQLMGSSTAAVAAELSPPTSRLCCLVSALHQHQHLAGGAWTCSAPLLYY